MISLTASVNGKQRRKLLDNFDETKDNQVMVISSCETIGEGIDTKNANMCVFVDPKSSYVKIIQNIGRIVRKQQQTSTILIPCWVDKTKYLECNNDKDKCDEVIREDMSESGNFNGILNVLSALKQEEEELYDICLHYPDTYSPQEIKNNLEKQGYTIEEYVGEGTLTETMEYLLDIELDYDNYENCETDEEMVMNIAEENNVCVEIHTNSLENPVERYNSECESGETIRLYKSVDEELEEVIYQPIVKKEKNTKRNSDIISEPKRENRMGIKVHTNPDIKVLWNITSDIDLTKDICSCVIDCEVVDNWYDNLEELKKFINENKKQPSYGSKNKVEKMLGSWLSNQKQNYKKNTIKDETRIKLWLLFLEEYKKYLLSFEEKWYNKLVGLKTYIQEYKTLPKSKSKIQEEKILGQWLSQQNKFYKNKTQSMKLETNYNLWTDFLEEYNEHFTYGITKWYIMFEELKKFIDENKKLPSHGSAKLLDRTIGYWLKTNKTNYASNSGFMKNKDIYKKWTEFLENYKEYFISNHDIWFTQLIELKNFINLYKKTPSNGSKNKVEKKIGSWYTKNRIDFKNNLINDKIKSEHWLAFINDYKDYIKDWENTWYENFKQLKQFINENNKRPSKKSENLSEKMLGSWSTTQCKNYKQKKEGMNDETRYNIWTKFLEEYKEYFKHDEDIWNETFSELKQFITENKKLPSYNSKNKMEQKLNNWINNQKYNYKQKKGSMKDETRYNLWTKFLEDCTEYFDNSETQSIESTETQSIIEEEAETITIIPKKSMKLKKPHTKTITETTEQKKERVKTKISQLHQKYKTMKSENLYKEFNENQELWNNYHQISEENEKSFPEHEIPRNRVITELNKIKTKRTKLVVDMGCGKGQISEYFKGDKRFQFINYDHVSSNDTTISCDISKLPLEEDAVEICILSLAMWGSNCKEYVKEANRILESGGKLYIIEPTKRWSEQDENKNIIEGKEGCKMKSLLEENGFQIVEQSIEKFCMFVCIKN